MPFMIEYCAEINVLTY